MLLRVSVSALMAVSAAWFTSCAAFCADCSPEIAARLGEGFAGCQYRGGFAAGGGEHAGALDLGHEKRAIAQPGLDGGPAGGVEP